MFDSRSRQIMQMINSMFSDTRLPADKVASDLEEIKECADMCIKLLTIDFTTGKPFAQPNRTNAFVDY